MKPEPVGQQRRASACPESVHAPAYDAGELGDAACRAFEAHLATCAACARELEKTRRAIAAMRMLEPARVSRDLAPAILARLSAEHGRASFDMARGGRLAAAAAAAMLVGGAAVWWTFRRAGVEAEKPAESRPSVPRLESARDEALAWLLHAQETNGSWDPGAWGGDRRYTVALSSLATLAMLGSERLSEAESAAVRKAAGYLIGQQNEAGEFGPAFDNAPYNHGMATLALLGAFRTLGDAAWKPNLDRAVEVIRARQTAEGGWGYWAGTERAPNLSVTVWQIEALRLAVALGWNAAASNLHQGARWVAGVADGSGSFGYRRPDDFPEGEETLTAMGALAVLSMPERVLPAAWGERMAAKLHGTAAESDAELDYYRAYCLTAAMRRLGDEASGLGLASVRGSLLRRQVEDGATRGSWDPDSRWGGVGGRLYATALATLSLQ